MWHHTQYRNRNKHRKTGLTSVKCLGSLGIDMKKSSPEEPRLALASNSASPSQLANPSKTDSPNQSISLSSGSGISKTTGEVGITKTAGETLVPQPHGGALRSGGKLGNKGGGRTPEEIKGSFRKLIAEKGLPWAERLLDAPKTVLCPKCGTEVKPPASDGVRARLLDTATRLLPQQVEHQAVIVIRDADSLSV